MALFDQIDGSIDVAVRAGGSFIVPYPAGRVAADYVATGGTLLIHAFGTIYASPSQFTYALGGSSATITLVTVPALPVKTEIRVGLPLAAVSVGGGAVAAVDVSFTATGNIAATNVQAALAELDTEKTSAADVTAMLGTYVAAQDVMVFKGVIDASANPNYPAASAGYTYRISVAGKIGGASGTNVEAGDILLCLTDGTASGTQAGVGANWSVIQTNVDGAVTTTGTQTLTNKTLTAPAIASPTGLVKGDVSLGNVDNTSDATKFTNPTTTGKLTTAASASGGAGFNLPAGAAPTSPANGDVWTTSAGIYARINGVTVGPLSAGGGGSTSPVVTKSANYTIVAGDAGKVIECTATLTLALTAAATLADGFKCYVRMSLNGGVVTIDPNSTELIDGLSTVAGYVGDGLFEIICDGTAFRTSRRKGLVLITKATPAAVAAADFEAGFTDAEILTMHFKHSDMQGASDSSVYLRAKRAGAYSSASYLGQLTKISAGTQTITDLAGAAQIEISDQSAAGGTSAISGHVEVNGYKSTPNRSVHISGMTYSGYIAPAGTATGTRVFNTSHNATGPLEGVRFLMSTGNIAQGSIQQFGLRS